MAVKWVWVCQRQAYYFYLLGSKNCSGLQPQSRTKELDFLRFPLSLHGWIYAVQTDMISRNIYFTLISLLSASIAAALRRLSDIGLTQTEFFKTLGFSYNGVLDCRLSYFNKKKPPNSARTE